MDPLQNDMANISIAFETDSLVYFEATLRETRINLNCLTENGLNLFHMLASDKIANEIKALQYLEILVKEYKDRYFLTEVSELLREAVNKIDDRTFMTPLMLAVLKKRKVRVIKRIIHQYIELGACFDAVDNEGRNVCHYAAYSGNNYMLALLKFHYRVDVDIQDRYGRTPLHVAILRNKVDTAKFLMVVSRSVNVEDMEGLTPFGYAIIVNSYTIAKHLLINRAEKLDLNSQNRVPMHFLNPKSDIIKHLVVLPI
jgi:ankyrin repeat protein